MCKNIDLSNTKINMNKKYNCVKLNRLNTIQINDSLIVVYHYGIKWISILFVIRIYSD